jgi:hypothetical protein
MDRTAEDGTMRLTAALLLGSAALYAQDLHVTASSLSSQTTRSMFGPLNKRYGSIAVSVCTTGAATTAPLASIAQQPGAIPPGLTVLPPLAALTVVAHAQNSTKKAAAFRIGIAVVEGAAVATSLAGIGATLKNVLTDTALLGSQLIPIIEQASTPNALVNYSQATLADPLQVPAGTPTAPGCAPTGIVLTESDPAARRADFRMPTK